MKPRPQKKSPALPPRPPRQNQAGPVIAASQRRNRWIFGLVGLLALSLGAGLGFTPLVRSVAYSKAKQRGLVMRLGSARPGWLKIHLRNVEVQPIGVDSVTAHLDLITVSVTSLGAIKAIDVMGGTVRARGPISKVRGQLSNWRNRSKPASTVSSGGSGSSRKIVGSDLFVDWANWDSQGNRNRLGGVHFELSGKTQSLGFASAEVNTSTSRWLLADAVVTVLRSAEGTHLQSAKVRRVEGQLTLSPASESPDASNPLAASKPLLAEPLEATVTADPKPASALQQRLAGLAALGWPATQARLNRLKAPVKKWLAPEAAFAVEEIQFQLVRGDSVLNFGPAPLNVFRANDSLHAKFQSPATSDGQQLAIEGVLPLGEGTSTGKLSGGPVPLSTLGVLEGNFGLQNVSKTLLTAKTQITLSPLGLINISATGSLSGLSIQRDALGPEALRNMNLGWGGQLQIDLRASSVTLTHGTANLGQAQLQFDTSVERQEDDLKLKLRIDMPETPCQVLFDAAPEALLPMLQGIELGGTLGLHSSVEFDTAAPKDAEVEWKLENRCTVLTTPEAVDPARFSEPFAHLVLDGESRAMEVTLGPTTDQWVPLEEISSYMQTAVMVCEDARFFTHRGFNNSAIRDSIASNLRAGRFVRGASTLTMQLAKNLYLGREKTISRKFQEAALTMLLEERLNKEDILELYFNVVEFGPGVYGIRQASQHYFNSHPGELSLAQALFFGSILPNPKATHFEEDGALNKRWGEHLQYLMRVAHRREHISEEELTAGSLEKLRFGQRHQPVESDFLFGSSLFGDLGG